MRCTSSDSSRDTDSTAVAIVRRDRPPRAELGGLRRSKDSESALAIASVYRLPPNGMSRAKIEAPPRVTFVFMTEAPMSIRATASAGALASR